MKYEKEIKEWQLAQFLHEVYEKHAIKHGWKTQEECRVSFDKLPEENKKVMLSVAEEVKAHIINFLKDCRVDASVAFVEHIENHLKEMDVVNPTYEHGKFQRQVICKICDMTLEEIYEEYKKTEA